MSPERPGGRPDAAAAPSAPTEDSASAGSGSLIRPTAALWVAAAVTLLGSLVRGKVIAESIGASGVGVVSQVTNLVLLVGSLAALGLTNAGVKLIAEADATGNEARRRRLVSFLVAAPLLAGAAFVVGAVLLREVISQLLFDDRQYAGYVAFASAAVPLNMLIASMQAVLQAHRRLVRLAVDSVLIAALTTVTAAVLVVPLGVRGAVGSIVATSAVAAAVMLLRERWIAQDVFPVRAAARADLRQYASLGAASLLATVMTVAAEAGVRSYVVHVRGITENGLYQPVYLLSSQVFVQLNNGLALVLLPSLAALVAVADRARVVALLARGTRLVLVISTPLLLAVIATADLLVVVFFSGEFSAAAPVLVLQVVGEVPRAVAYAVGALLIPAGLVRGFLLVGLLSNLVYVSVAVLLLESLGLQALAVAYIMQWVVALVVTVTLVRRSQGSAGLTLRNKTLALAATLAVGGAAAVYLCVSPLAGAGAATALALLWCALVPTSAERRKVLAAAARLIGGRQRAST